MSSFPGPQKKLVEGFIFRLFEEKKGKVTREEMLARMQPFALAPDVQVFFDALGDRPYSEDELIDELNRIIERFGRTEELGGPLNRIEHTPEERARVYGPQYESKDRS